MFNLVTVTGCSGGSKGPQGVYKLFENVETPYKSTRYITTKEDISKNVNDVISKVQEFFESNKQPAILMGHSMGGAVVVQAAQKLEKNLPGALGGLVLINSQTDGIFVVKDVSAPLLTINSDGDTWFPVRQLQSLYSRHKGVQRRLIITELSHDLEKNGKDLSKKEVFPLFQTLVAEMNALFIQKQQDNRESPTTWTLPAPSKNKSCVIL